MLIVVYWVETCILCVFKCWLHGVQFFLKSSDHSAKKLCTINATCRFITSSPDTDDMSPKS